MNKNKLQKNILNKKERGFTLIEAMVAIFILSISITGLMSLVSSSLFASKYAKNEITASYLAQEVVDYIRNDRDTIVFLGVSETRDGWEKFYEKYKMCSESGINCYIDVMNKENIGPVKCEKEECFLFYDERAKNNVFYNYDEIGEMTSFQRKLFITRDEASPDEIKVEVVVSWKNGASTRTRSLKTSVMKWQ